MDISFIKVCIRLLFLTYTWRSLPIEKSLTILIYKKAIQIIVRNISLLSTVYKIYSRIISDEQIRVSSIYNWICPDQKGPIGY